MEERNMATKYPFTDSDGVIHITFQDTYDLGRAISSVKSLEITSFQTGCDKRDEAVLKIKDNSVFAVGCGQAEVTLGDGEKVYFTVHPSPINLLLLTGQSNASGDPPDAKDYAPLEYAEWFKRSPETMAYYIFTGQSLTVENARKHVPDNLVWDRCATNTMGCDPRIFTFKDYKGGFKNFSVCAGLAYEWINQTGERVLAVNSSHGGQPIHCFRPSADGQIVDNDYYQAVTTFNLTLEMLYREVDAGHFTLNHMAYYWYQGEGDSSNTYEYYLNEFRNMHAAMMNDVVYRHGGVEKRLEFCGILTIRSCKDTIVNSELEYYITGPRLAQYIAMNELEGVFSNVYLASKINEDWIGSDENVEKSFLRTYGSEENFKAIFGYDMPKTIAIVKPSIHYRVAGHNEEGMDAARNSLKIINFLNPDSQYDLSYDTDREKVELTLVSRDGYTPITDTLYFDATTLEAYLLPQISPAWRTVEGLSLKVSSEVEVIDKFVLKLLDVKLKSFTVEVYLGDKLLETRTLKIKLSSGIVDNPPLCVNYGTSLYPDRHFEHFRGGWDSGVLNFADGSFNTVEAYLDGCLAYNGTKCFSASLSMEYVCAPDNSLGAIGFRYTFPRDGRVKIGADRFVCHDPRYVSVFLNGKKVVPNDNLSASDREGWTLLGPDGRTEDVLRAWEDVRLDVKEGDKIVFCLCAESGEAWTVLHPYVEYVD